MADCQPSALAMLFVMQHPTTHVSRSGYKVSAWLVETSVAFPLLLRGYALLREGPPSQPKRKAQLLTISPLLLVLI